MCITAEAPMHGNIGMILAARRMIQSENDLPPRGAIKKNLHGPRAAARR
jgi:hypothetical protein